MRPGDNVQGLRFPPKRDRKAYCSSDVTSDVLRDKPPSDQHSVDISGDKKLS